MNRDLVMGIGVLFVVLSIFSLQGELAYAKHIMIFVSIFTLIFTFGQLADKSAKIFRWLKSVGSWFVALSFGLAFVLAYVIVNSFPSNIDNISNAATFFSLALVFMMVNVFED